MIPLYSTLAVTGHRPDKLGGYGPKTFVTLWNFAEEQLQRIKPKLIYTGMAQGWDMAIAAACLHLHIPYIACIPCEGQASLWTPAAQADYYELCERAEALHIIPGEYAAWKMQKRNEYMIDNTQGLLALYNGTEGGTANTVNYAKLQRKPILNLWKRWEEYI